MFAATSRTLAELEEFARGHQIPVVLMPIDPFYYQTTNTEANPRLASWGKYREYVVKWGDLIDEFNNVLKLAAKDSQWIFFLDTRPIMDGTDRRLQYIDFIHLSPEGHRLVAKVLQAYMEEHSLLPAKKVTGREQRVEGDAVNRAP